MESLYVLVLQYLRKNYQLINFKALNSETSKDMAAIMADPYYLSEHTDFTCRYWYEHDALQLYIAESQLDNKCIVEVPAPNFRHSRQIIRWTTGTPSSRFAYMSTGELHDLNTGKYHKFNNPINDEFKHNVYSDDIQHLVTKDFNVYSCYGSICKIVEDQAFDMFPGFIEWAEKHNFISEQITISRYMILKKQKCINYSVY